ncbi:hypothetical protein SDC9_73401 [bioreactor metagenome]|uniref:Uncharacterized protein n=1 Tax=bioreactor metagenome TaxID=1076179 RepID=A0A644YEH1_9ZZZZ
MKIEVGESLILSWLRHCKNCQVVQLNWKPSTSSWELYNEVELENLMAITGEYFKTKYGLDIYKQNRSVLQLLNQGEIDALGVTLKGAKIEEIYAVDIAFHEGGLNYGNKEGTIASVVKKMLRTAMIIYGYFDLTYGDVIFASPKVNNSLILLLEQCIGDLNIFMREQGYNFNFILHINNDFKEKIFEPVISMATSVADTSELFMRSIQMYNLFSNDHKEKKGFPREAASLKMVEPQGQDLSGLEEVKIGALVRSTVRRLVDENKLNEEMIHKLTTYEYSKTNFNINYPFLLQINKSETYEEQRKVNGRPRYWSEIFKINEEEYYLCQEWFESNRSFFMDWLIKL